MGWNEDELRDRFPPLGWLSCRHFRIDLWLTGVVREHPESSSKAESPPSSSDLVNRPDSERQNKIKFQVFHFYYPYYFTFFGKINVSFEFHSSFHGNKIIFVYLFISNLDKAIASSCWKHEFVGLKWILYLFQKSNCMTHSSKKQVGPIMCFFVNKYEECHKRTKKQNMFECKRVENWNAFLNILAQTDDLISRPQKQLFSNFKILKIL